MNGFVNIDGIIVPPLNAFKLKSKLQLIPVLVVVDRDVIEKVPELLL